MTGTKEKQMDNKTYQDTIAKFDMTQADYAEKYLWRMCEPGIMQMDHYIHGLSSEVGELSDAFKKYVRDGKACDGLNLKEELGDLLFYVSRFATLLGTNLEDLQKMNLAKLDNRYPLGFAENPPRDIKAEQLAMLKSVETEETRAEARELKRLLTEGDGGKDETP